MFIAGESIKKSPFEKIWLPKYRTNNIAKCLVLLPAYSITYSNLAGFNHSDDSISLKCLKKRFRLFHLTLLVSIFKYNILPILSSGYRGLSAGNPFRNLQRLLKTISKAKSPLFSSLAIVTLACVYVLFLSGGCIPP